MLGGTWDDGEQGGMMSEGGGSSADTPPETGTVLSWMPNAG